MIYVGMMVRITAEACVQQVDINIHSAGVGMGLLFEKGRGKSFRAGLVYITHATCTLIMSCQDPHSRARAMLRAPVDWLPFNIKNKETLKNGWPKDALTYKSAMTLFMKLC